MTTEFSEGQYASQSQNSIRITESKTRGKCSALYGVRNCATELATRGLANKIVMFSKTYFHGDQQAVEPLALLFQA